MLTKKPLALFLSAFLLSCGGTETPIIPESTTNPSNENNNAEGVSNSSSNADTDNTSSPANTPETNTPVDNSASNNDASNDSTSSNTPDNTTSNSNSANTPSNNNQNTVDTPVTPTENSNDNIVLYAVNAGGTAYTAIDGTPFEQDNYFNNDGMLGQTADGIDNTEDDTLFQSERWGTFGYTFPLAAGEYDIDLYMIEGWYGPQAGNRIFDVEVEGETPVDDFDPLATAGHDTAHILQLSNISVNDGALNIDFTPSSKEANVAAIVVRGPAGAKDNSNTTQPGDTASNTTPPRNNETDAEQSCGTNDLTICLDFEGITPGSLPEGFSVEGSQNAVQIVNNSEAYSGDSALRFDTSSGGGFIKQNAVSGTHWGRLFYKMDTPLPSPGTWFHTTFVKSRGGNGEFRFVDTVQGPDSHQQRSGVFHYLYNVEPGDIAIGGNYDRTFSERWVCVEWHINAQDQTFFFYEDGNEILLARDDNGMDALVATPSNATNATNLPGFTPVPETLDWLGFGVQNYQGGNVKGWIDDIAVGDARIGCEL